MLDEDVDHVPRIFWNYVLNIQSPLWVVSGECLTSLHPKSTITQVQPQCFPCIVVLTLLLGSCPFPPSYVLPVIDACTSTPTHLNKKKHNAVTHAMHNFVSLHLIINTYRAKGEPLAGTIECLQLFLVQELLPLVAVAKIQSHRGNFLSSCCSCCTVARKRYKRRYATSNTDTYHRIRDIRLYHSRCTYRNPHAGVVCDIAA